MGEIIFDSSCLLRTFSENYLTHSIFLRAVYLFNHYIITAIHPWSKVSVFLQKKRQSYILWRLMYLFWQEILQSTIVWVVLSAEYVYFQKKLLLAMCAFKGTVIISIDYSLPSSLSTVQHIFLTLEFAAI